MKMERRCEFCMSLSPIVYCKADAAHLCLSCDFKVHSANALSYRHPRTLVCESCRYYPALIRCLDHAMFMCQSCDANHHSILFQHQKRVISCYVGCPSAKDLAALWGLDLNKLDNKSLVSRALNSDVSNTSCEGWQGGSSSAGDKGVGNDNQQEISYLILQQIQDLERIQLYEGLDNSRLGHVKERTGGLSFRQKTISNNQMEQQFNNGQLDFQNKGNHLTEEPLSSPFSQLENLTNAGNLSQGDSYWQCKSPLHNNEIWLQNMQDLGVCDEVKWMDDVTIPDVDLTFRNFEELFGSEHEPGRGLVDDKNTVCSFAEFDRGCVSATKEIPGPTPVCLSHQPGKANQDDRAPDPMQRSSYQMRPSYSTSSFSVSRMTGESSGSEYKDDGISPTFPKSLQDTDPHDPENTELAGKGNVMRHKEKKVLRHETQALHKFPRSKSKSDHKKRGRNQALKTDTSANVSTRSF